MIDVRESAVSDSRGFAALAGLITACVVVKGCGSSAPASTHAQCMRTHDVPGYQDPTFPPNGRIAITDAGTNPQSPAYRHAAAVCGNR
jgi:hypothetical protein